MKDVSEKDPLLYRMIARTVWLLSPKYTVEGAENLHFPVFDDRVIGVSREKTGLPVPPTPIPPMAPSDFAVILCDSANGSTVRGVEPEMIDTNMPEEIPAPQAPQKPHAPPGTFFPRFIISERAFSRSISPPAFR